METNRVEIPAVIPQWQDQELYNILYPKQSLMGDVQGCIGPVDEQAITTLYQVHLAHAVDVHDLMTGLVVF